jgi:hypothetical protein
MVRSGDQGVNFVERGLCVTSSLILLTFHENLFVSIVARLPPTSFLLSFIHNMVETKERQQRDKTYNNIYHLHVGLIIKQTLKIKHTENETKYSPYRMLR